MGWLKSLFAVSSTSSTKTCKVMEVSDVTRGVESLISRQKRLSEDAAKLADDCDAGVEYKQVLINKLEDDIDQLTSLQEKVRSFTL